MPSALSAMRLEAPKSSAKRMPGTSTRMQALKWPPDPNASPLPTKVTFADMAMPFLPAPAAPSPRRDADGEARPVRGELGIGEPVRTKVAQRHVLHHRGKLRARRAARRRHPRLKQTWVDVAGRSQIGSNLALMDDRKRRATPTKKSRATRSRCRLGSSV